MQQLETILKEVDEIGTRAIELSNQISKDESRATFFQNRYEEIMAKPDPEKWIGEMVEILAVIHIIKHRLEDNLKELMMYEARLRYLNDIMLPAFRFTN